MQSERRIRWAALAAALLLTVLLATPATVSAEDGQGLSGSVEFVYRSVSNSGSENKYNEDFDGLENGTRLGSLALNWLDDDNGVLDYARLEASGLGGDPYERTALRLGRKDRFELSLTNWSQDYIYDLFELAPDEDGATWNTEREQSEINLRIYPNEKVKLFFGLTDTRRTGDSLFMKDIERELFRLETPLDQQQKRYTVGAQFEVGVVDVIVRQTMRRYDNRFNNSTENDLGIDSPTTQLNEYDWLQRDSGGTDLTTLTVHAPLGDRVNLTLGLHGTFLGDEELNSQVNLEQLGLDFLSSQFGGTCSISSAVCASDADCGAGDTCVPDLGNSSASLDGDHTLIDADLSIRLAAPLDLHLQYRSLDRDLDGVLSSDLNDDGTFADLDGDGQPGSTTRFDYEFNSTTALLDYRPTRKFGMRGGLRLIDRSLIRAGYGVSRDTDLESDDDETWVFGFWTKPVKWFRLNADYEDGEVSQPFNAVAPQVSEHTRVRASFTPDDTLRIDLSYLEFDRSNTAPDIRAPGSNWDGEAEGTTSTVSFWHRASEDVTLTLRYSAQEIDTRVGITFDTAGFGGVGTGDSIFNNDNEQVSGRIDVGSGPLKGWFRYWVVESDGRNLVRDPDLPTLVVNQPIMQEYEDLEIGVTYDLGSGAYVGMSFRDFTYDDINDLIDYEGEIFTVRGGYRF